MGNNLGTHGFTGTGSSEQKYGQPSSIRVFLRVIPILIDLLLEVHLVNRMLQGLTLCRVHNDIFKAEVRLYLRCLLCQLGTHLVVTTLEELGS